MKSLIRPTFMAILVLGSVAAVGLAQTSGTGAISGRVTDPAGAVVVDATVSAINQTTGEVRTTASSATGTYLVSLLNPANYRLEVSKAGFKVAVQENIPVHITETETLNIELVVGATKETVEVVANAELLQTQQSTLGHVVDQREVVDLPLVTRNYTQILGLSPGVSAETFNAGELGRGGLDDVVSSGGSAWGDNNFQMNGVEINDLQGSGHFSGGVAVPNPDSVQEFKVQTSQYDASYGRNAGANVDVLTKGGTNNWHGTVWEFLRNEALNANDYFRNETGQPRAELRQNQFGFTAGGPIKKDKLLFFTSYQGTRQRNGIASTCSSSVILPVLTSDRSAAGLAQAVGAGTAFGGMDPLGRAVTADNVSSQALALFNAKLPNGQYVIPNPQTVITDTATGLPEGFSTFSDACPYGEDQFLTDLDWMQNTRSTFQGRFFFANSDSTTTLPSIFPFAGTVPGAPATSPQDFRNFSLTHTYAFTGTLVNQASVGFHRTFAGLEQQFPFKYSDIGSTVPSFEDGRPVIAVLGGMGVGGNGQTVVLAQNTVVFQDTLSWTRGRHSLRFGGSITHAEDNQSQFEFGAYSVYLNYPGLLLGQAPFNPYETIDLPGILSRDWRVWDSSLYAQDDIKLTSRLTLNLGLRYERLGDFGEINGRNANVNPALIDPNPPAAGSLAGFVVPDNFPGAVPAGVTKLSNDMGINGTGQNTFDPRIGFAWMLPGSDRVVLRGGYGIYHQRAVGQLYLQQVTNQPFALYRTTVPDLTNGIDNPFPQVSGSFPQFFPYSPSTSLSPVIIDPNLQPPVFQRYSMSLQTQIAKDMTLEIGYAGMRGTHMIVERDINQAGIATAANPIRGQTTTTLSDLASRVAYEGFSPGAMTDIQSAGFAWYNSLQASLNKRFSHGLQFLASYTFARDLANARGSTDLPNGGVIVGDNDNPSADYGPDEFVRPHRFVFSGVYDLPGPKNLRSLLGETLGGWKLAGVATLQSGHLLPLLNNTVTNAYGVNVDFAQIVPGCALATTGSETSRLGGWVNPNCLFAGNGQPLQTYVGDPDPAGTCAVPNAQGVCATGFGNSSMGILHGPSQVNTDLSLMKDFPVRETMNFEFRSEFFNAFNHPIFADPDNTVSDGLSSFGHIITTASNPRVIQFALKLTF